MIKTQIKTKIRDLELELAVLQEQIPQDLAKIVEISEEIQKYEAMLEFKSKVMTM